MRFASAAAGKFCARAKKAQRKRVGLFLFAAILLLVLVGGALLWMSRRAHEQTGLPQGEVIYSDVGIGQAVEKPIFSRRFGIVGRPDYLVTVKEAGRNFIIPVEVKSRQRPPAPFDSHILQLAAYCLLVEDHYKQRPPYGLLRYADATLKLPFTNEVRQLALDIAAEIRTSRTATDVARQHHDFGRCRGCGYRAACGEQALGE